MADDSGLPEDQYVNTFYFITGGAPTGEESDIAAGFVGALYKNAVGGVGSPASFLSGQLSGLVTIKTYNMADALPRTPIETYTDVYSVDSEASVGLPPEVAVCLSYAAAPVGGIPASRLRGRIYFGPLASEAAVLGTNHHAEVSTVLMARLTEGAEAMQAGAAALELQWAMYSPTRGAASPIVKVWCDNAFDTQRRRGNDATSRTTITF